VQKGNASTFDSPRVRFLLRMPLPRSFANYIGRKLFRFLLTIQGLGAFAIITIGVMLRKIRVARHVIWPLMFHETARAGLRLLPMFLFMSAALGLLVIGQTVSWLTRVGAINYLGTIMVLVVVRELGPLLSAFLVLARVGTSNVIELGTARALGEVEALEALAKQGIYINALRIRSFPFQDEINDFVRSHSKVFVVEQNRDAQLKTLLVNDAGINPAALISVLHYDGTPITARFITKEISEIVSALNVRPIKKDKAA